MMKSTTEISDQVTVLVFKDNYVARTFRVPLRWISKFGIVLGLLVIFSGLSVFAAAKYYWISRKTDPARVQDLEQEVSDLKTQIKLMEHPIASPGAPKDNATPNVKATDPVTFAAFPSDVVSTLPDPKTLPISLSAATAEWRHHMLRIRFALQYTRDDQGNQQGRIVLLARGPETLLAYPAGAMNPPGSPHLIALEKGESFSVSRYREVKAEFGPLASKGSISTVEVFVFNKEDRILVYEKISVPIHTTAPPAEKEEVESE